jgi:phage baseplate assembly protein W
MAINRADALTGTHKKEEYFSDFLDDFDKTPFGDQLARSTNEQSINKSLIHLIKTDLYERLFQPGIGSNVNASLFEMNDIISTNSLQFHIETTIGNYETRINLIAVKVISMVNQNETTSSLISPNENSVKIIIVYNVINNPTPITLSFILKKIR